MIINQKNKDLAQQYNHVETDFHNLLSSIQRISPACHQPLLHLVALKPYVGNMCALFVQCQMIRAVSQPQGIPPQKVMNTGTVKISWNIFKTKYIFSLTELSYFCGYFLKQGLRDGFN